MTPEAADGETPSRRDVNAPREVSGLVDWMVGGLLVLVGLAMVLVGFALREGATTGVIADMVADGTIESDVLSPADVVEVTVAVAQWSAIGLLVTGAVLAIGGIVFVYVRHRAHREAGGDAPGSLGANALYGAVVAAALSFVPASTVLGGAAAAYLNGDRDEGATVGALSGAISGVPVALLVGFVLVGVVDGVSAAGESAGAFFLAGVGVVAVAVLLLFVVALGAVGGGVGGYFLDRSARRSRQVPGNHSG
jgi:hypothetical protein